MRVQTFTEFVGELPVFEDDENNYDLSGYLYRKEDEYRERHNPDLTIHELIRGWRGPLLKKHPDTVISKLDVEQQRAYIDAYKALNIYIARRELEFGLFRGKILDFGCGSGGTSIFLHNQGGDVTAIDTNEERIDELKKTGLFPEDKTIHGNGLDYMLTQPESSFDLIVAMGLGQVNCHMGFIEQFYIASTRAVKPDGKIFVESDMLTMDKVREVFGVECPPFDAKVMVYQSQKHPANLLG